MYHAVPSHGGDDLVSVLRCGSRKSQRVVGAVGPLGVERERRGERLDDGAIQGAGEPGSRRIGEKEEAAHRREAYADGVRYRDRTDAGRRLASAIEASNLLEDGESPLVLGVPRGGVPVAAEVANRFDAELDVLVAHKLGVPGNPEFAIGAVAEDGSRILDRRIIDRLGISDAYIEEETARQLREVERRARFLRRGRDPISIDGRTCIVVDDGVATGSTLEASLRLVSNGGASRVIAAIPVGPPETIERLAGIVDAVVCPVRPRMFYAVGAWYEDFTQVSDETVTRLLAAASSR